MKYVSLCLPFKFLTFNTLILTVNSIPFVITRPSISEDFQSLRPSSLKIFKNSVDQIWNNGFVRRSQREKYSIIECTIDLLQCNEEEICTPVYGSTSQGICQCKDGWIRNVDGNCAQLIAKEKYTRKICEIGLQECLESEFCKPISNRRKNGFCACRKGFSRNLDGDCIQMPLQNGTSGSNHIEKLNNTSSNNLSSYNTTLPSDSAPLSSSSIPANQVTTLQPQHVIEKIIVNINNKTVVLPEGVNLFKEWTSLSAYAIGGTERQYQYTWSLLEKPESKEEGAMSNMNSATVSLSNLIAGVYVLKVAVSGSNAYGEASGNITVIPAKHTNKPPVAIIVPASQIVKLPSSVVIFEGSGTADDTTKIVSYQWELVMGPLGYKLSEATAATLQMTDLLPGNYTIMLKVKDEQGLMGNTTASLVIVKETDYPPTANAGGDKIIYLPQTDIILNGNSSTDDHGIVGWEWTKGPEDSGNAVDMQDTRTPYLKLSNLEKGHYHFILKVVDTAEQSANSSAHVYVHSAADNVLQANAGENVTLIIPNTTVILDGSKSTGISAETHFLWRQISGPTTVLLKDIGKVNVNASGLTKGVYMFQLMLWNGENKGENSTSNFTVKVIQDINAAPVAFAGGDFSITLPISVVIVNGSSSSDDVGITKWLWRRDYASLASGTVIKNSDQSPVLLFTNVIPGRYIWNLTVWDDQGASSSDTVSIIVKDDPNLLDELEVVLGVGIETLSVNQLTNLIQRLQLLLHLPSSTSDITFKINGIYGQPLSGSVTLIMVGFIEGKVIRGPELATQVKSKLVSGSSSKILDLPVISVDTVVCQNNCSGHGECIQTTKECRCQSWWMESSFRRHLLDGTPNCEWSVIYVFVCLIGAVFLLVIFIWLLIRLALKYIGNGKQRKSNRSTQRYSLLEGPEEGVTVQDRIPESLLDSGSDSESDSEVLFDTRKPRKKNTTRLKNGHIKMSRLRT